MRAVLRVAATIAVLGGMVVPVAAHGAKSTPSIDKIQHVLILVQENRSFDDYLGQLRYEGQPAATGEPRNASNPNPLNPSGPPIRTFHQTSYCETADLNHSWTGVHQEIDGGKMDGFTAANEDPTDPTGSRAMGYYTNADLPFYYSLFSTFATGDRYFASVPGPTYPNREYLLAGTSFGHIMNDTPSNGLPGRTVFNELDEAGISWKIYFSDVPAGFIFQYVRDNAAGHVFPISQYYADAAAGNLPQVAYVDPGFVGTHDTETDEHPSSNPQSGQEFVSTVVNTLFKSPEWPSSALFITYDEHGGFYDHVVPPAAVAPDDIAPLLQPGDVNAGFTQYGIRVPAVVVSPYSRAHYVTHTVYDHTSILRFVEVRFGLPALTRRDAAASPMLDFFDFSRQSFATPPALAAASIDAAKAVACAP